MLLLFGSGCDLHREPMLAIGGMDGQRHLTKPRLRRTLLNRGILRGGLRAARGECDECEA